MKYIGYIWMIVIGMMFIACSSEENNRENESEVDVAEPVNEEHLEIEKWMSEIDNNMDFGIYSSLEYRNKVRDLEVHALKDTIDTNYVKIIEYVNIIETNAPKTRMFYLKDGKKLVSRELFEEVEGENQHFVERITYYDENEKPLVTKTRTATFEEELEMATFQIVSAFDAEMDRPMRALQQKGEFAPRFESFLEHTGDLYIIVGENKPDGYTSALLVQSRNGLVDEMYRNPEKYVGRKLSLAFTKEMSPDGNYQLLLGASLVE